MAGAQALGTWGGSGVSASASSVLTLGGPRAAAGLGVLRSRAARCALRGFAAWLAVLGRSARAIRSQSVARYADQELEVVGEVGELGGVAGAEARGGAL